MFVKFISVQINDAIAFANYLASFLTFIFHVLGVVGSLTINSFIINFQDSVPETKF